MLTYNFSESHNWQENKTHEQCLLVSVAAESYSDLRHCLYIIFSDTLLNYSNFYFMWHIKLKVST